MSGLAPRAASPCVNICRLDEATGWCRGCGRSGEEIGAWRAATEADRAAVFAALPARLADMDAPPRAVDGADAAAILTQALNGGGGVSIGPHGALADFLPAAGRSVDVERHGGTIRAVTAGGRLRIALSDATRVFDLPADAGAAARLLAAPPPGALLAVARGLTRLGPDPDPVAPGAVPSDAVLVDLGLGFAEVRFMIRTADAALLDRLVPLQGAPLARLMEEAGEALLATSPTRVVETPHARVEVDGPIPPPSGRSPRAPHTHLMPGAVALGRLMPPGVARLDGLVPVATVHPFAATLR